MVIIGQKRDVVTHLVPGVTDIVLHNNTEVWSAKDGNPVYLLGEYDNAKEAGEVIANIGEACGRGDEWYKLPAEARLIPDNYRDW